MLSQYNFMNSNDNKALLIQFDINLTSVFNVSVVCDISVPTYCDGVYDNLLFELRQKFMQDFFKMVENNRAECLFATKLVLGFFVFLVLFLIKFF